MLFAQLSPVSVYRPLNYTNVDDVISFFIYLPIWLILQCP